MCKDYIPESYKGTRYMESGGADYGNTASSKSITNNYQYNKPSNPSAVTNNFQPTLQNNVQPTADVAGYGSEIFFAVIGIVFLAVTAKVGVTVLKNHKPRSAIYGTSQRYSQMGYNQTGRSFIKGKKLKERLQQKQQEANRRREEQYQQQQEQQQRREDNNRRYEQSQQRREEEQYQQQQEQQQRREDNNRREEQYQQQQEQPQESQKIPKQHYAVLEIEPSSSPKEIKDAYRSLIKFYHPDKFENKPPEDKSKAEKKTMQILDAYEELKKELKFN